MLPAARRSSSSFCNYKGFRRSFCLSAPRIFTKFTQILAEAAADRRNVHGAREMKKYAKIIRENEAKVIALHCSLGSNGHESAAVSPAASRPARVMALLPPNASPSAPIDQSARPAEFVAQ